MAQTVHIFGLTGGIACGKSTVARCFRARGVGVVDADGEARRVVEPGSEGLSEIVRVFGADLLSPDGTLDRRKLGARVFADAAERRKLEGITHPRIRAASMERARQLSELGHRLVAYEAALLVEVGQADDFRPLVVVVATETEQLGRLMARDGIDEVQARARLAAQMPLRDKVAVADHVIDTSCELALVRDRADAVLDRLCDSLGLGRGDLGPR